MSDLDALLAQQASGVPKSTLTPNAPAGDSLDSLLSSQAKASPSQPVAATVGAELNSIPRQLGLTARYGLEGAANAAQIVTEPIRNFITDPLARAMGGKGGRPLGEVASGLADAIGLPQPQGANERVIGDATRLVAGAGGMGAAANSARVLPGIAGKAAEFLGANMPQQLAAAAGSGAAGGASREAGGGFGAQLGASLLGGVAGGIGQSVGSAAVDVGKRMLTPKLTPQQVDTQITAVLNRAGVDYSQIPADAQRALRADLADSLRAGRELDPQAVARLADFRATNTTPTRGMVSQNPVQITREMNLAKTGANSSDEGLQGLALMQNRNNARLIGNLNEAGASQGDQFRAGGAAIGGILNRDAALEGNVSSLYQQARDTSGRSANLDGHAFTTNANRALDEAMVGGALPPDVANHMNRIARGEVPFTVDYAEQLKTRIGALQRGSSDGSTRMALGTVRRALDDTPLMSAPQVNPGNLPAVPGTVPPSPSVLGQESIGAFNQARTAARERFGWQESARPIEAALGGAQPDKFIQQYVLNGTVHDAEAIAAHAPLAEVKNAIMEHLKSKALNGAADEVGKFSQSAFNRELTKIGDRKLALFFSPEEIANLRANGRVASYMQVQPVGSAVNNSNSGALMLGKGYDALRALAARIPGGQSLLLNPLNNIEFSVQNRQAQNVVGGLLRQQQRPPLAQSLLLPGLAAGGLLAAPSP